MLEFYYENIFRLHFLANPILNTNQTNQIGEKENRYPLFYQTLLHTYTPFHSLIEKHHCDENHLPKKDLPYKLVHLQLSMQDVDQRSPTNANQPG